MKKLMILGGTKCLIPVIEKAKELGVYTITCDYLPDNIAHKYSDEYCNVSVIDKDKVFEVAKEKEIDGIMSFACDAGAVSAAYTAEKLGLPFQGSYESVRILQDKGLFRKFLLDHGFNSPNAKRYTKVEDALKDIDYFNWPVIVKPVDSAGSKCVNRVNEPEDLEMAIDIALSGSHCDAFIIEDFLTFEGFHSSTDVFTVNGEVKFITYSDQLFDEYAENPYTPARIIWPTTMKQKYQDELTAEIQRLMNLLDMKNGIYNIETCVANGKPYIMEVSPRGGGCEIARLQYMAYGVDLIENDIRAALGMPLLDMTMKKLNSCWCESVIHSDNEEVGLFDHLDIKSEIIGKYIRYIGLSVAKGDEIHPFTGGNMALGDIIFEFKNREELEKIMAKMGGWLKIVFAKEN